MTRGRRNNPAKQRPRHARGREEYQSTQRATPTVEGAEGGASSGRSTYTEVGSRSGTGFSATSVVPAKARWYDEITLGRVAAMIGIAVPIIGALYWLIDMRVDVTYMGRDVKENSTSLHELSTKVNTLSNNVALLKGDMKAHQANAQNRSVRNRHSLK